MPKQMHLGSLSHGVGSHVAGWRMPGAETEKENFDLVDVLIEALHPLLKIFT